MIEAVAKAIGIERVGIRLSPNFHSQGVEDSDPKALYEALARRLEELGVPWIELREPARPTSAGSVPSAPVSPVVRRHYSGGIVINSDYEWQSAKARVDEGHADAVSIGRPFIANPDLVRRIRLGAALNEGDPSTFYSGGAAGYVDYPFLDEPTASAA